MQRPRPSHADDLDEILATAFRLFARGVVDRRSPFHTPVLATAALPAPDQAYPCAPGLRTVVLRGFDPASRALRIHTDARSAKVPALAACPAAALHVYDAAAQIQVRLSGLTTLHHDDDVAARAWGASRAQSRMCYGIDPAPGTPVALPPPAPSDPNAGRPHFSVVELVIDRLEWLWLAAEGHRRALFTWTGDSLRATWLAP